MNAKPYMRLSRPQKQITYNDPMYKRLQALEDIICEDVSLEKLRAALKHYRVKSGLSQLDLATLLGIEQSNVCLWETGKTCPSLVNLIKLANVFGLKAWALLKEVDL